MSEQKEKWVPSALKQIQEEQQKESYSKKSFGNGNSKWKEDERDVREDPRQGRNDSRRRDRGRKQRNRSPKRRQKYDKVSKKGQTSKELELELFGEVDLKRVSKGINFDRYDDIPVKATGNNIPDHVDAFEDSMLDERLQKNLELCGFSNPTPVQKYAIPISTNGRDLMACAQTGSGKTAAFLLPAINLMMEGDASNTSGKGRSRTAYPRLLVLAPTRELATQIYDEARRFSYATGIRGVVVYGGQSISIQLRNIERGCDMIVATPGRLLDLIDRGRISLRAIEFLVLDEADRMLDMGFEPQINEIVHDLGMPEERQTMMFSATFPREMQFLAQDFLRDYVFLTVGRLGSTNEFIVQKLTYADEYRKRDTLMEILRESEGLTLIFVETKRGADSLEYFLLENGVNAITIHGDRSQPEREYALAQFRQGLCPVLVATDVAARGLDIPNVLCVINFDLPSNIDDYVHRIGRTGRCGNSGTAYSFVSERNRNICRDLFDMLKDSNQEIPDWFEEMVFSSRGQRQQHKRGKKQQSDRFGATDLRRTYDAPKQQSQKQSKSKKNSGKSKGKKSKGKNSNQNDDWDSFGTGSGSGVKGGSMKSDAWDSGW